MKKAKNIWRVLAAAVAVILLSLCLLSCQKEQNVSGYCTVVVAQTPEKVYTVDLDKVTVTNGLISVLEYLKETEGLTYVSNDSGYGAYLTSVGGLSENAAEGTYIYIYTSVEKDFDVSAYAQTKEYEGKTLTSSGVGASQMTVEDGAIYYITTVKY